MSFGRLVVAGVLIALTVAPANAAPPATVVRTAGEVSPLGWPYSSFGEGSIDAAGRLLFVGSSTAIFERDGAMLTQRIGAGIVLPDGRRASGVGPPVRAADGCVIARTTFSTGDDAIVRACGDTFTVLLDAGTAPPSGGLIRAFEAAVFVAGVDTVAATATLETGSSVVLLRDAGGVTEIARSGAPAPTGGTYASFRVFGVTADGTIGFRATVSGGPDGLFAAHASVVRSVALVGQGSPAGGSFTSIGGGRLHPSGQLAFRAAISTGQSGVFATDLAIPIPVLRSVALQGDPLPLEDATIRSFAGSIDPSIDASGTIAFRAVIAGATDPPRPSGVFTVGPDGHVTAIASVREAIDGIGTISRLRDPVIADDGSLVLSAVVAGVGPGLYVYRAGVFSPLARLGDATTADTGDARFRFAAASVTNTAESAVYLGERDAIFQTTPDGSVLALAYTGRPGPLGGIMAQLGSPVADGRGNVYFGADFQGARFNEALLVASSTGVEALVTPDRRLLGGGGIRELFASSIDTLGRPASGVAPGVVFTAALQGATAAEGIFRATSTNRVRTLARVGQRAGSHRLAALGTPSVGPGGAIAFLAAVGRDDRRTAIVAGGTGLEVVAIANAPTRTRVGGKYGELGPPAIGRRGAVFRATLRDTSTEAIFVGRGGRVGVVAATDDTTSSGGRLRSFDDPLAVGEEVWFLARIAGNIAPSGLYRAHLGKIPGRLDPPVEIEPVLLPGDPAPAAIGGVIVTLDAPRVGPSGTITIVAGIGGGTATSAILQFVPGVP